METDALRFFLLISFILIFSIPLYCAESFVVSVHDRIVKIESPIKVGKIYSVIVENKSLSDLVAKFHSNGEDLRFVSVKSNSSKSVEFSHQTKNEVIFKILSPAFQELVLEAGKKSYEVPPVQ